MDCRVAALLAMTSGAYSASIRAFSRCFSTKPTEMIDIS
jgi:hypothetical protein